MGKKNAKPREEEECECTLDGSVDRQGRPAVRSRSGSWGAGILILVNQGLATLAFFGVGVNLVLFLTRVMGQDNASAANNVSKWTGTVYLFSLVGAFLSDSYWGRYKTCAIFQVIYVIVVWYHYHYHHLFLVKPDGCGDEKNPCGYHSTIHLSLFYVSIYLIALGNGGYQPTIATFGADQFDEDHPKESHSKVSFFSYFYLALNLGSLFSNTILGYYEDKGVWAVGFWASGGSATLALLLFLLGTPIYRHITPKGNPFSRFCQVITAATRKWKVEVRSSDHSLLYEVQGTDLADNGARKILHTHGFRFLDRAAVVTQKDGSLEEKTNNHNNPWRLCSVTQVEEVKCILRLLPIWLCTIPYSVVFTQMTSLFVEQGAAMKTWPLSSSSAAAIRTANVSGEYRSRVLSAGLGRFSSILGPLTALLSAGAVEHFRLLHAEQEEGCPSCSSLSIFWQVPQYVLIGASEVFMYVGQLEFFNSQAPDGLKSFGSALSMTSISLGNYVSSLIVTIVMKVSTLDDMPGWIPRNLNRGRLDRFYYLLAALTAADFVVYVVCARWYKYARFQNRSSNDVLAA
ncbi:hypothetical protein OROGR_033120 [Orobanche gracilis]